MPGSGMIFRRMAGVGEYVRRKCVPRRVKRQANWKRRAAEGVEGQHTKCILLPKPTIARSRISRRYPVKEIQL